MGYGMVPPKGISCVRKAVPGILGDAENVLAPLFRGLPNGLYGELVSLGGRIHPLGQKSATPPAQHEDCQRPLAIPGVGLLAATALMAAIGDVAVFKNGREAAAWLGLVPKQHSAGGKQTLVATSKRGGSYLRTLLVHGGRPVARVAHKHQGKRSRWTGGASRKGAGKIPPMLRWRAKMRGMPGLY
jgi:transposase